MVRKAPFRVAIYGKGGIGKSTISSNLSYNLSRRGFRVLHIGCDPKHDSTRNLVNGERHPTVLEAIRGQSLDITKVVVRSDCGADCVEAGGPEPGIGCAGRGIITALSELKRQGLDQSSYDVVIYDVLGDVVCGGFAIPMRSDHSDVMILVTSEEAMSIYALNNILKGALNHDPGVPRIGGIVLNSRLAGMGDATVESFAEAVELPIICRLSRDSIYATSERVNKTVSERFPDSEPAAQFSQLTDVLVAMIEGRTALNHPRPLDDISLDSILKGRPVHSKDSRPSVSSRMGRETSGEACAARGAVSAASEVVDLPIIVHGPRACGFNMANIRDVHFLGDQKTGSVFSLAYRNNVYCTDMTDGDSIFGGIGRLECTIESLYEKGLRTMMVITACIPGIIGDDVDACKRNMEAKLDGLQIILIKTDGNIRGDVREGISEVRTKLAGLIGPSSERHSGTANLIYTAGMGGTYNSDQVQELLGSVGLSLRVILFKDCTLDAIRSAGSAEINIPMTAGDLRSDLTAQLRGMGLPVSDNPIPLGVKETEQWIQSFGGVSDDEVARALTHQRAIYENLLSRVRTITQGKTVCIGTRFGNEVDWVVETLEDMGMEVTFVARIGNGAPALKNGALAQVRLNVGMSELMDEIQSMEPDLFLCDFRAMSDIQARVGTIPRGNIAIQASIALVEYVTNIFRVPRTTGVDR